MPHVIQEGLTKKGRKREQNKHVINVRYIFWQCRRALSTHIPDFLFAVLPMHQYFAEHTKVYWLVCSIQKLWEWKAHPLKVQYNLYGGNEKLHNDLTDAGVKSPVLTFVHYGQ